MISLKATLIRTSFSLFCNNNALSDSFFNSDRINEKTNLDLIISDLRTTTATLQEHLDLASKKIEDQIDLKYDMEQTMKKISLQNCVSTWRAAVAVRSSKELYENNISDIQDKLKKEEKCTDRMNSQRYNFALALMRLSDIFASIKEIKKDIFDVFFSYRVDDLNVKKSRIQILEVELEKLGGKCC